MLKEDTKYRRNCNFMLREIDKKRRSLHIYITESLLYYSDHWPKKDNFCILGQASAPAGGDPGHDEKGREGRRLLLLL